MGSFVPDRGWMKSVSGNTNCEGRRTRLQPICRDARAKMGTCPIERSSVTSGLTDGLTNHRLAG